jgi:hypothetical protein
MEDTHMAYKDVGYEFEKQMNDILKSVATDTKKKVEEGLDEASRIMQQDLESHSPIGLSSDENLKGSWMTKKKYQRVRYVGSTKLVPTTRNGRKTTVPLTIVLEHGAKSPHRGFMRRRFQAQKANIILAVKKAIEGGNNNG